MKTKMMIVLSVLSMMIISCSKQKQQEENMVKVKSARVSLTSIEGLESYSGTIEACNGVNLSFAVGGTVKQMNIAEGQRVRAGQLMALLDATTLGNLVTASSATVKQTQAALSQAEKLAAQAHDTYTRMALLHDNGSLPEIKWEEVKTRYQQAQDAVTLAKATVESARAQKNISLKNLRDTRLDAPVAGYIAKKWVEAGQNVAPGQPIVTLVDIRRVKVKINVSEDDIARIQVGQKFRFRVSSLEDAMFTACVTEKGVAADPVTRSYEVKAIADNVDGKILPGMICDVFVQPLTATSAITLPANIIQIDVDNRPFVWTVVGGMACKTMVMLGQSVGDRVQIVGGLSSQDQVIIEGQQKVCNGMKVQ